MSSFVLCFIISFFIGSLVASKTVFAEALLDNYNPDKGISDLGHLNKGYYMHVASLKNQFDKLLKNGLPEQLYSGGNVKEKSTLPKDQVLLNSCLYDNKNSLYSDYTKKSIATLAKNGQLPSREPEGEQTPQPELNKRFLEQFNGYMQGGKRNIGSIVRQLPNGKRKWESIGWKQNEPYNIKLNAMDEDKDDGDHFSNILPAFDEKVYTNQNLFKKNIGALKNSLMRGGRQRRESLDENGNNFNYITYNDYPEPDDYLDFHDLKNDKRFLGLISRDIQLRENTNTLKKNVIKESGPQQKRHIGSIARSGLLPSFRPIHTRGFYRSGRAKTRSVEFYPQQEQLQEGIAAACKRYIIYRFSKIGVQMVPKANILWTKPPRLTTIYWKNLHPAKLYL